MEDGVMNKAKSRVNEFGLIYMGYMTFLAARKSYGFWLPSVLTTLQVSRGEAGVLGLGRHALLQLRDGPRS